jgi:hypothetical protein
VKDNKDNYSFSDIAEKLIKNLPLAKMEICDLEKFNAVCSAADLGDMETYEALLTDSLCINISLYENRLIGSIAIHPITYLAYQGKHNTVKFLLDNNSTSADVNHACQGYALAGNLEYVFSTKEHYRPRLFIIDNPLIFLAIGGYFELVFSYSDRILKDDDESSKQETARCLAEVLHFAGITKNPQSLFNWLIEWQNQFNDYPLLIAALSHLKKLDYDPLLLVKTTKTLLALWAGLYPWFLQAPRFRQNQPVLPAVIIWHIASFLFPNPVGGYILSKHIPFLKTRQLLLLNLNSIAVTAKQKELPKRLTTLFRDIKECQSLNKKVQEELDDQKSRPDEAVTKALQNCQFRLSPLL